MVRSIPFLARLTFPLAWSALPSISRPFSESVGGLQASKRRNRQRRPFDRRGISGSDQRRPHRILFRLEALALPAADYRLFAPAALGFQKKDLAIQLLRSDPVAIEDLLRQFWSRVPGIGHQRLDK